MRLFLLPFILLCLIPAALNAQAIVSVQDTTEIAPTFEFITMHGEKISSDDLKGKIVILDFWSTDCAPCIKSMSQMEKFYQKFKNDKRIAIYLVNSGWESLERARSFAHTKREHFLFFSWGERYDLPFAYDNGSATLRKFKLDSNPSTIIIDTGFRIRIRHSGYIQDLYGFLSEHVNQLLAQQ